MDGFKTQIEEETLNNQDFRRVIFTGKNSQLVIMTLQPGEEIGVETHPENDQFFRFESGRGKVVLSDDEHEVGDGDAVVVVAGTEHNIVNLSVSDSLKFYTIYSPPHHPDGTVHKTKAEADEAETGEEENS